MESEKTKKILAETTRSRGTSVADESQIMETLDSPFIIKFQETFHDRDHAYLVMELVQGKSLEATMEATKGKPLDIEQARLYEWL
jgi:serine/threonine protein kinase